MLGSKESSRVTFDDCAYCRTGSSELLIGRMERSWPDLLCYLQVALKLGITSSPKRSITLMRVGEHHTAAGGTFVVGLLWLGPCKVAIPPGSGDRRYGGWIGVEWLVEWLRAWTEGWCRTGSGFRSGVEGSSGGDLGWIRLWNRVVEWTAWRWVRGR